MKAVLPICLGLAVAAALFIALAMLLTRQDLRRFLKAVAEGRFEVARVDRGSGERFRTLEISGAAGDRRFVLAAVLDPFEGRARYRLKLDAPWAFTRSCRLHDIGDPFARAHRCLLRRARSRQATGPEAPRRDAA